MWCGSRLRPGSRAPRRRPPLTQLPVPQGNWSRQSRRRCSQKAVETLRVPMAGSAPPLPPGAPGGCEGEEAAAAATRGSSSASGTSRVPAERPPLLGNGTRLLGNTPRLRREGTPASDAKANISGMLSSCNGSPLVPSACPHLESDRGLLAGWLAQVGRGGGQTRHGCLEGGVGYV